MDKDKFVAEIEQLLYENGAVKELQTKMRAELVQILLNKKQPKVTRDLSNFDKALNLLILEHLMLNGHWYSASILASEADFLEPPPEIETVTTPNAGTFKRHNPAKLERSTILNIIRALKNPGLACQTSQIELAYETNRSKSLLSLCLENTNEGRRPAKRKTNRHLNNFFFRSQN